jgi:hypothetical protein
LNFRIGDVGSCVANHPTELGLASFGDRHFKGWIVALTYIYASLSRTDDFCLPIWLNYFTHTELDVDYHIGSYAML